jgi:ubiquinone/menaquinone biosynthesis C-methylase UbiE
VTPVTDTLPLDTSYEPFAQEPAYLRLNAAFVDTLPLSEVRTFVDVACGTGVVTGLVVDRLLGERPALEVVGVDLSAQSLQLAREAFAGRTRPVDVRFVEASGDRVPVADTWADLVTVGNALHLFHDLAQVLGEVRRISRPGATFAFNSSFYAGTFAVGTGAFYTEWMRQALRCLSAESTRRVASGLPALTRRRGSAGTAFSHPWLTPEQYADALGDAGFRVTSCRERTVLLGRRELEAIGSYAGLAAVLLSGYPVDVAARALADGVAPALEASDHESVERRWLEVVAVRP